MFVASLLIVPCTLYIVYFLNGYSVLDSVLTASVQALGQVIVLWSCCGSEYPCDVGEQYKKPKAHISPL